MVVRRTEGGAAAVPAWVEGSRSSGSPAAERPFTVLVVDDDDLNRRVTSASLRARGYAVVCASDGAEALERVAAGEIDLVVLDLVMPGMGGFDTLATLRRRHPPEELPVVIATSCERTEDVVRAFRAGASDYVTKPFDPAVLEVRVEAQLRGRRRRAEVSATDLDAPIEPGAVLGGRYELGPLVGTGAFGFVYKARHRDLDSVVAVKVLRGDCRRDPGFRSEGVSTCRIDHPNVVQVRDFGVTSRGAPYLVMEYLEGWSLKEELERQGRLDPWRCLAVLEPLCAALAEAHRLGLVHRDVKPSNVFLHQTARGEVPKLLDFGLAAPFGTTPTSDGEPLTGHVEGTPAYVAPERFLGEPYDGRSDVYSVGVLLYEALVGRLPFGPGKKGVLEMMLAQIDEVPSSCRELCPELSVEIDAVVQSALAKAPERRPAVHRLARAFRAAVEAGGRDPRATGAR